jgi:hypothetical protein
VTNPRTKSLVIGALALALIWGLAFGIYRVAQSRKMTADKVIAALRAAELEKLDAASRQPRLRDLAAKFNALGPEDRRRARFDDAWARLWRDMTEEERAEFIERTMPTGFRQMITAFEQMPEDRRRAAITNTLARLERARDGEGALNENTNRPILSEDLQKKVIATGLKTFYAESSAQTKAEMAPVLEEMQRLMESGRLFRNR